MVVRPAQEGMIQHMIQGICFELPIKYEPIKLIGKGTYGSVISANNKEKGEQVAIKKLSQIDDLVRLTVPVHAMTQVKFRLMRRESSVRSSL